MIVRARLYCVLFFTAMLALAGCRYSKRLGKHHGAEMWQVDCSRDNCERRLTTVCAGDEYTIVKELNPSGKSVRLVVVCARLPGVAGAPGAGGPTQPGSVDFNHVQAEAIRRADPVAAPPSVRCAYIRAHKRMAAAPQLAGLRQWLSSVEPIVCANVPAEPACPSDEVDDADDADAPDVLSPPASPEPVSIEPIEPAVPNAPEPAVQPVVPAP